MNQTKQSKTKQIALGGVLAALAVVILLLGGVIPIGTYLAPMLASLPLIVLLTELPRGLCLGWYAVVAILGAMLCPDRETAFVFVPSPGPPWTAFQGCSGSGRRCWFSTWPSPPSMPC